MNTIKQLQDELESLAPKPPRIADLEAISQRQHRRQWGARTAVAAMLIGLAAFGIAQMLDSSQTVETTAELSDPADGANVSQPDNPDELDPNLAAPDENLDLACAADRGDIGFPAKEFLGLSEAEAVAKATQQELNAIVECRDGVNQVPVRLTNIDDTRVWLTLEEGIVTAAYRL